MNEFKIPTFDDHLNEGKEEYIFKEAKFMIYS
jgi:hypothetical protein